MRAPTPVIAMLLLPSAGLGPTTGPATAPADPAGRARHFAQWFLDGDGVAMASVASPELRAAMGPPGQAKPLRDQLLGGGPARPWAGAAGEETTVTRTVVVADGRVLRLVTTVDAAGQVTGFRVVPDPTREAWSPFLDYQTKAAARLPFDGVWTVAWGGRTVGQNYHAAYPDQRFAYDLLIERAGVTHAGDGTRLNDYFCYGQPVLAPAAGTVVGVVGDRPDNAPGHTDPAHPPGNHVVLDLGGGEFAFLCHLQPGSPKVRPGDAVTPGQPLGLCGNSGNTTEPHLHVHLQTTPTFGNGRGLPLQFGHYTADGKPVARGEPTRGERIDNR